MRPTVAASLTALIFAAAGCYHATIETGAPPSMQTIEKTFASGWLFGLVPPSTVQTAAQCPNGVAKVETQLSFVNQLVSFLTLSIYTPMNIKVTCAGRAMGSADLPGPSLVMRHGADEIERQTVFTLAADLSLQRKAAVWVVF